MLYDTVPRPLPSDVHGNARLGVCCNLTFSWLQEDFIVGNIPVVLDLD